MQNKNSDKKLYKIIQNLIQELINAEHDPAELCFTMVEQATILGIEAAASTELAMLVVMDGVQSGCATKVPQDEENPNHTNEEEVAPKSVTLH